jgi:DNA-binding HxlR family transcriptional regulator
MIIPEDVKTAVSALSHQIRWRIIELIQEHEKLSYTEMLQRLAIHKGSLTHHLNRLMEAGMIDNYSEDGFFGPFSSYYQLSPFGKDLLMGLLSSFQFKPIPIRIETYEIRESREPVHPIKSSDDYTKSSKPFEYEYSAEQRVSLLKNLIPVTGRASRGKREEFRVAEPRPHHK